MHNYLEPWIVEVQFGPLMRNRAHAHHPMLLRQRAPLPQEIVQQKVAEVVCGHLGFEPILSALELRRRHDGGVVDEDVDFCAQLDDGSGGGADGGHGGEVERDGVGGGVGGGEGGDHGGEVCRGAGGEDERGGGVRDEGGDEGVGQ